jgi:hypothetical protein
LDYINVNDSDGFLLSSVDLSYTTMGATDKTKRLLSSIVHYNSSGQSLPGHSFQYITSYSPTTNFGALSSITTPAGGVVNYSYAQQTISRAVREKKISPPISGYKEPKVWIGPDYVVVTWRQLSSSSTHTNASRTVQIQAFTWDGEWIEWDLSQSIGQVTVSQRKNYDEWESGNFGDPTKYKLQDFHVTLQRDFFAVLNKTSTNLYSLNIYRKNLNKRGGWTWSGGGGSINLGQNILQDAYLVSGENFIAVASKQTNIFVYRWSGTSWTQSTITRNTSTNHNPLVAGHNFIISHRRAGPNDEVKFHFFNEDGTIVTRTPPAFADNSTNERSYWYPAASFAAVMVDDNPEYFYVWDENYNITRKDLGYGLNDQSFVNIINNSMFTVVDPGVAANYAARYNGDNFVISTNLDGSLVSTVTPNPFSFGEDFLLRPKSGSNNQVGLTYFNPNSNSWSSLTYASAAKTTARAGYNFFVKTHSTDASRAEIVYRRPNGIFSTDPTSPTITDLNTDPARFPWQVGNNFVIKNRGATGSSTFTGMGQSILLLNGKIDPLQPDFTQSTGFNSAIDAPALHWTGDFDHTYSLVGGDVIVTFLNQLWQYNATEIKLYKLINGVANGNLTDFAVQKISVNDGVNTTHSFIEYDLSRATYDASGSFAQYNKVTVYPGVQSANVSNGSTEYFFYNGIKSNEAAAPFPYSYDNDFTKTLTGTSYKSQVLDNLSNVVSYSISYTSVFSKSIQQGATAVDIGYYIRPTRIDQSASGSSTSLVGQSYYSYNANGLPVSKATTTGTQTSSEEYKYWYEAYDPTLTRNILTPVIQTKRTLNSTFVACVAIKYKNWGTSNTPAPFQTYAWKKTGSSDFTAWAIGATPSTDWRLANTVDDIDVTKGLIRQTTAAEGIVSKTIWDANGKNVMATITLPQNGNVIYNGFEDCTSNCSTEAKTGFKSSNGTAISYTGLPAGTYKVTYWRKSSTQADWEFIESTFTGTSYSIPHTWIDELRIAPVDARIVSYAYDRYGNVTSECDQNNMITYKDYDAFNRPIITRDQDRKIRALTTYNIKE